MQKHYPGIDYLRIFLSWAVVAWHMRIFGKSDIFDITKYKNHVFNFSDLINFHVLLLAVPTFIFISCFLFADRNKTDKDLDAKIKKYVILLVFWASCWLIWFRLTFPESLQAALNIIAMGIVGTPYYFFLCLIFSLILTFFAMKLSTKWNVLLLTFSCFSLLIFPYVAVITRTVSFAAHQNPLSFLPYPFGAVILSRVLLQLNFKFRIVMGLCSVIMGILLGLFEWRFEVHPIFFGADGYAIPPYMRASSFFFSAAGMVLCVSINPSINRTVNFLSTYSLGLYCLHLFFMKKLIGIDLAGIPHEFIGISRYLSLIALCYVISIIMKFFVRKDLILTA